MLPDFTDSVCIWKLTLQVKHGQHVGVSHHYSYCKKKVFYIYELVLMNLFVNLFHWLLCALQNL